MKKISGILFLTLCGFCSQAQLSVSGGYTAQQLAEYLAGPNITVFNATLTGAPTSYGKFINGNATNLGLNEGVVLTSGSRDYLLGPNNTSYQTGINNTPGDADLSLVANQQTLDATVLEFQFQVQTESIEFSYVFGSEEYIEFIDGQYNDAFAFFISGPGITGKENIALIPNTTTPVVTSTVNSNNYWQYYIDNPWGGGGPERIQYDGFTTVLKAKKSGLIPCEIYTLKLAVADGAGNINDDTWDSGVMLKAGSLVQGTVSAISNTIQADSVALEGCVRASFTFSLDTAKLTNTEIKFNIAGTAINGVDYNYIDSIFTIPAGQTSATIFIDPLNDGYTEGRENIMLIYSPRPCADPDTVMLYIDDTQPLNFNLSGVNLGCAGDSSGQINIAATGGFPPYTYTIVGGGTYTSSPITGLPAGAYTIRVDDSYGCKADAVAVGAVFDAGATFLPDGNGNSYTSTITLSGFSAGQTLTSIDQLQSICAKLEHSSMGEVKIELIAPNGTIILLKEKGPAGTTDFGEPVAKGPTDGGNSDITPGKGYDYCWTSSPTYGTMMSEAKKYKHTYVDAVGKTLTDFYLPTGSYLSFQPLSGLVGVPLNGNWTLKVTDSNPQDNGYIFNWGISLKAGMPDSTITLTEPVKPKFTSSTSSSITKPSCSNNDGAINISVSGANSPYSYSWSNGAITEDITGIAAGSYKITITDASTCKYDTTFLVQNQGTLTLGSTHTDVTCPGLTNGTINLTATGGTAPYTYSWSNGAITEDLSSLAAGTYTVTVTDKIGCIGLASADIIQIPAIKEEANIVNEKCGNENGTIDLSISGGTTPYTYSWSNGSTIEDQQYLQAGTYTVTIRDKNNCSASRSYSLINEVNNCVINCDLVISNVVVTDETCGSKNGSINITVEKGTQPYVFKWSTGATTEDLLNIAAGTYSVEITDINGCTITQSITLNNLTGTLAFGTPSIANETCGDKKGAINISISGGALPYLFSWSNTATTEDISSLNAGIYSVKVTDANGCAISASYEVKNNSGTLIQTYGNAMDEVCGNKKGSIDITISGGATPYAYSWSNGATSQDLVNLSAGTYRCKIRDYNGCIINTPDYIVNNNSGTLAIFDIDIVDEVCGNQKGRINVDMSGGTTPYTYSWSNGQTTQSISNLSAGNYSCVIRDKSGCSTGTGTLTLLNSSGTLSLDAVSVTNETCNNNLGAIDITVSGGGAPYSYLWNTGKISEDINNLSAGTYSCAISDTSGCKLYAEATVSNTSGTLALANSVVTNETCGNKAGAINLFISGGTSPYSFSWSNGSVTEDISGLSAGVYNCIVKDNTGCEINISNTVTNSAGTLSIATPVITNEVCGNSGGSINISVSGGISGYTYSWSNGSITEDIAGLAAGTYFCQVTDATGCKVNTGDIVINNSSAGLTVTLTSLKDELCGDKTGAINISVSGGTPGYTYSWSNGAVTQDISALSAGSYTVKVIDAVGCSSTKKYDILNKPGTLAVSAVITDEICGNQSGSINLSVSGGTSPITYSWSNGAVIQDLNGVSAGNYSCLVTDANGCSLSTATLTVGNSSATLLVDDVFVIDEQCGDGQGQVYLSVSGGTSPLTFNWSNGAVTEDIINLSSGSYTCTITDGAGCSVIAFASVYNQPGTLSISDETVTNATCGNSNGAVNLTISGGGPPYTFSWSNGASTEDISGLAPNSYSCLISDANGCFISKSFVISNVGNVSVSDISVYDEVCGSSTGSINITVAGGSVPYTYAWSNGRTTEDITGLSAGTYNCMITEANGCSVAISATVKNSSGALSATGAITNASCGNNNGAINLSVSGGSFYYYYWSNGSNSQDISGLAAGTYTCTIYNSSGCSIAYTGVVSSVSSAITVNNISVTDESCGNKLGAINLSISGGTSPYTFSWNNGQTTQNLSGLTAGTYSCSIKDMYGCTKIATATLINNAGTLTVSDSIKNAKCGDATGSIDLTVSGGTAPFTYSWSTGAISEDISGLTAGTYTYSVKDNSGCALSNSIIVSGVSNNLTTSNIKVTDEVCNNSQGSIELTMSGGISPYTYSWNNGGTTRIITGLATGTYSCDITDAGGCTTTTYIAVNNTTNNIGTVNAIITDEICNNSQGAIELIISGGISPYTYSWSNGGTTRIITGLSSGMYACNITDGNGCTSTTYVMVNNTNGNLALISAIVTNESCNLSNGAIDITPSGGMSPYSYSWSSGQATQDLAGINAGMYICTVTDSKGCSIENYISVGTDVPFKINDTIITHSSCSGCADGAIDITLSTEAVLPVSYSWSNGADTEDIFNLVSGTYIVTITDADSCGLTAIFNVESTIGITDREQQLLNIYPNPTTGNVTLKWLNGLSQGVDIEVSTLLGAVILSEKYSASEAIQISLDDFNNGTYILKIRSEGQTIIKRIILSK